MTVDHSCKIFPWYLPNWTSTDIWCVVHYSTTICYVHTCSTTHQRLVEVQFGRYQGNILQEWSMVKNLSCASYETWNVFPISSLLADRSIDAPVSAKRPKRPRWVRFFSLSYWHPLGTHCPFMSWFWLAPHTMIYFEDAFGMPLTLGVASRPNEFILTLSVGAF